jgi:hypothetical protein
VYSLRRLPCQWHLCLRDASPSEARQRGSGESPTDSEQGPPSQVTHTRRELTVSFRLLEYHGRRLHAGADFWGPLQRSARVLSRLSPVPTPPPRRAPRERPQANHRAAARRQFGLVHARPSSLQSPACVNSAAFCHSDPRHPVASSVADDRHERSLSGLSDCAGAGRRLLPAGASTSFKAERQ